MQRSTKYLCENIQGAKLAYTQSDEISILVTDYDKFTTDAWFDYNVQKMCSISASILTLEFNRIFSELALKVESEKSKIYIDKINKAMFDSRVFNIPKEEVCNYFIWRQKDATRNAISMIGRAFFSHKELQNLSSNEIQEKLWSEKSINFNEYDTYKRRGSCIIKHDDPSISGWFIDKEIPIFTKDRNYIEKSLSSIIHEV